MSNQLRRRGIAVAATTAGACLAAAFLAAGPADAATTAVTAAPTSAGQPGSADGAVFVVDDALAGNHVVAYRRAADGTLARTGSVATGGRGGRLDGAAVDFTASQGALTADRRYRELLAVNAGSDSVSVLDVRGASVRLRQVIGSGGSFPVSVTAHDGRVFVLNARNGGSIHGFVTVGGRLVEVPQWHRELGLPVTTGSAEFTHTPGQVAFTPDGRHLVVTTKASTNSILVYSFNAQGWLADQPVVHSEDATVPFAVAFDPAGDLDVADAGVNAVASYRVGPAGTLTALGVTPTGQSATCWIAASGTLLAASNAGSATVTTLRAQPSGATALLADTATGPGTVDASFIPDGRRLYVQTGGDGAVDALAVAADGSLTALGSVTVPNAVGAEGIVAW